MGGFVGETVGWRWVEGVMAISTGILLLFGAFTIPETYAPVLLQKRAKALSKRYGKVYISILEKKQGKLEHVAAFKKALSRPWALLFLEPIVLLISIYMAILYGNLYMLFGAFPIVFQEGRGWSEGIGGLAFLGVAVGMVIGSIYSIWDNGRYKRSVQKNNGEATREMRLPPACVGAAVLPLGLFWFAWTNSPEIHWIVCVIATAPFGEYAGLALLGNGLMSVLGFGMVIVFLSCTNYLIDAYTIFAASVLAANSVLRSLFGAAFPLFTTQMYDTLGVHWASTIPAFLALACLLFPLLFYKYGAPIRMKCRYAKAAHDAMAMMNVAEEDAEDEEMKREKARA